MDEQQARRQGLAAQLDPAGFLTYKNQSAIRNKPLSERLVKAMGFLPELGITMEVGSGGQDGINEGRRRTGSTRHDHGEAGDVRFIRDGKPLSWENPQDIPTLQQIIRQARTNGVTGIGAGPGYMNPMTTHIGFGRPAIWGARGGSPYPALQEAAGQAPLNPTLTAMARRGGSMPSQRLQVPVNKAPEPQQPLSLPTDGSPAMDGTTAPMGMAAPPQMTPEQFQTAVFNSSPGTGNEALNFRLQDDAAQRGYASWDQALAGAKPKVAPEQETLAKLLSGQWG